MLKQQLQQRLQQKLSPQQIQLIKLLELPVVELEDRIKQELQENPALEEGQDTNAADTTDMTDDEVSSSGDDIVLGDYLTEDDIPEYKLKEISERAAKKEEIPFAAAISLNERLIQQLSLRELTEKQFKIAEYIIGNLDNDGYLRRENAAIADDLMFQVGYEVEEAEIEEIIKVVQDFDPPGIAARNLRECLLLQLSRKEHTETVSNAICILTDHFSEFSRKHYDKILSIFPIGEAGLKAAISEITILDPKPGSDWSEAENYTTHITPDFIVEAHNGELFLSMNSPDLPYLQISPEYVAMYHQYSDKRLHVQDTSDTALFLKQKIDSAQWFIDAINQRKETLHRTMEAIVEHQKDFFLTGNESSLRPMILKDISERAGYDKSTISRVSNSKYVQTNFGIYSLKYFFSDYHQTNSGEEVTSREVKKFLKEYINGENKRTPLTDDELTRMLNEHGFIIARRTVAKYREQMEIPVARLRKEI
ncbi:MAG: RNA polymerase factor sigma-54 [Tannerellaceae bacterium]|nr:RNA polymerase factor sigma-54 [Tannerellaceae bacterium]